MIKPTHTYIGRCKTCRLVLASVYDMEDDPKATSKYVAQMIASGLEIERVELGSVDIAPNGCGCRSNPVIGLPLFQEPAP